MERLLATARREERASIDRRGSGEIEIAATFRFVFSRPVARACVTRISSFYHLAARLKFARLFHQCKLRTQRWEMQRVGGGGKDQIKKKAGADEKEENFAKREKKKERKRKNEEKS